MSDNLIWIFSIVSIVSSILLVFLNIILFKMRREINKLEVENSLLKLQVDNCKEHLILSREEPGTEEDKAVIKWAANLSEVSDDENSSMNWILWPPKADNIFQDLIEYQKIKESESNKDKK